VLGLIETPPGKPALARDSDPRPAIDRGDEFAAITHPPEPAGTNAAPPQEASP
jgi:hypothetical protein